MSILKVEAIQNAAGVEQYLCKAWVNFNGTGTVAIRASGNVSSITDNGVGDYTVNFTTAMPDAKYALSGAASFESDSHPYLATLSIYTMSTSSARVLTCYVGQSNGSRYDSFYSQVAIFR